MRKLIVSMNVTLDGYLSGANCELDWHFETWTKEMAVALCDELSIADTILLGRVTYNAMAQFWPLKAADPLCTGEDLAFATMMNAYRKIIFSQTLSSTPWSNSVLATGNLADEINLLKSVPGKNIIVLGSAKLVNSIINAGLVDEYQLWIHPVILGQGKRLFNSGIQQPEFVNLKLGDVRRFGSGIVLLNYQA